MHRKKFSKFIQTTFKNLVELPAIYCQGKSTPNLNLQDESDKSINQIDSIDGIFVRKFTMLPVSDHNWHRAMNQNNRLIILMMMYSLFSPLQLVLGTYQVLESYKESPLWFRLYFFMSFIMQSIFFILYPLINYSYYCFCTVLRIQLEHLNQFIQKLTYRSKNQFPLREELNLIRVWYCRLGQSILEYDRLTNKIFFVLYIAHVAAMLLKSKQVSLMSKDGNVFTIGSFFYNVQLGLYCFGTIQLSQLVYSLNQTISKSNHYINELCMHPLFDEPMSYTKFIHIYVNRFNSTHYQLTFLRVIPIGKEFFLITSLLIISAVASFGSFGEMLLNLNHKLHLIL